MLTSLPTSSLPNLPVPTCSLLPLLSSSSRDFDFSQLDEETLACVYNERGGAHARFYFTLPYYGNTTSSGAGNSSSTTTSLNLADLVAGSSNFSADSSSSASSSLGGHHHLHHFLKRRLAQESNASSPSASTTAAGLTAASAVAAGSGTSSSAGSVGAGVVAEFSSLLTQWMGYPVADLAKQEAGRAYLIDYDGLWGRVREVGSQGNRVLAGLLLHQQPLVGSTEETRKFCGGGRFPGDLAARCHVAGDTANSTRNSTNTNSSAVSTSTNISATNSSANTSSANSSSASSTAAGDSRWGIVTSTGVAGVVLEGAEGHQGHLPHVGTDPAFSNTSSLYSSEVSREGWHGYRCWVHGVAGPDSHATASMHVSSP